MKPILIVDNEGRDSYQTVDLQSWVEGGIVDFRTSLDRTDHIDPSEYATAFVHQSNKEAYDWAKKKFQPVFFFTGERVSDPYVNRHMYFMSRRYFLEKLPQVLAEYQESERVEKDMFEPPLGDGGQLESTPDSQDVGIGSAITFTSGTGRRKQHTYPVRRMGEEEGGDINFVDTLRPLGEVEAVLPIFLEETYDRPRDGLELLLRIRLGLGPAFRGDFQFYPIYIRLKTPLEKLLARDMKYAILCTPGTSIVDSHPSPDDFESELLKNEKLTEVQLGSILDQLPIRPHDPKVDHHDLTNEWGALRLWFGYQRLTKGSTKRPTVLSKRIKDLLQREYFAYLSSQSALNRELTQKADSTPVELNRVEDWRKFLKRHQANCGRPLQVLLIDDEAEKGWEEVLSLVLSADVDNVVSLTVYSSSEDGFDTDEAYRKAVDEDWDVVLCDLRLELPRDRKRTASPNPSKRAYYSGIELVESIKRKKPATPVIAFTASKTTWTTRAAQEAGVDGYWVKESPEHALDEGYSQQSVSNLYSLIQSSVEERRRHAFLWSLIEKVRRARDDSKMLARISDFHQSRSPGSVAQMYEHVEHLLLRAYGYLDVEATSLQREAFRYDPAGIAFIHLWGCLNQITDLRYRFGESEARLFAQGYESKRIWDCTQGNEKFEEWVYDTFYRWLPEHVRLDPCRDASSRRGADYIYSALLLAETGKNELSRRLWDSGMGLPLKDIRNKLDFIHGRISLSELETRDTEDRAVKHWKGPDLEGQVELSDLKDLAEIVKTGLFPERDY
jgi:DNA-binding NarL/FixJ family response regulator